LGAPGSVAYLKTIEPTPKITLEGKDKDAAERLIETLDEHDDVVEVWSNLA